MGLLRDGILRSVEESLTRLGLDRIDIAYLHDPDEHWEAASTSGVGALIELRDQGVVSAVGAGMNQAGMLADFVERCDVDVVMVAGRYTLLDDAAAERLLPLAAERGVGVVAAAVYNSGLLSPRPPADATYDYPPLPQSCGSARTRSPTSASGTVSTCPPRPSPSSAPARGRLGGGGAAHPRAGGVDAERYRTRIPASVWAELSAAGLVAA